MNPCSQKGQTVKKIGRLKTKRVPLALKFLAFCGFMLQPVPDSANGVVLFALLLDYFFLDFLVPLNPDNSKLLNLAHAPPPPGAGRKR